MSFFANPLAEEEEVVPPDYPLEQYEELKREDDFNELLVRATKLESRHASGGAGDAASKDPRLDACLQHFQQLRASVEQSWQRMSEQLRAEAVCDTRRAVGVACGPTAASSSTAAIDRAVAEVHQQVAQRKRLGRHLRVLLEREAAQPTCPASTSRGGGAPWAAASTLGSSAWCPEASDTVSTEDAALERGAGAVHALEALLPAMNAEEAALAGAAVQQLYYGLQSRGTLRQRRDGLRAAVVAKSQERAEAQRAAEAFARWTGQRQLSGDAAAATATAPLSFDLATAEDLNRELSAENTRLEATLARLVAAQPSGAPPQDIFAGSALVQLLALTAYSQGLEEDVARLGRAVLCLRGILADPDSGELWSSHVSGSESAGPAPAAHPTAEEEGQPLAHRVECIRAAEVELQAQTAAGDGGAAAAGAAPAGGAEDAVDAVLSLGLRRLAESHSAGVRGMALLSACFEKQAANAAYLSHAMRGGGAVNDATVRRVLDVQRPDVDQLQQCCADIAAPCAGLAAELREMVTASIAAAEGQLTRWQIVRRLLTDLLRSAMAAVPDVDSEFAALLAAHAERPSPSSAADASAAHVQVRGHVDWAAAVFEEEAAALAEERATQRGVIVAHWAAQQAEAKKKMAWLMKQPNAALLTQLCDVERESEQLRDRLASAEEGTQNASELHATLIELQRRVAEEAQTNAAMRAELEELEAARRELKSQRSALLSPSP
ncbi:hypothetical protein NESM_000074800 [Novymonas esmeraldas]|uniref:Uncharacterized protein n=1 Tax=Novymonas esmeraldas TaxID=1808958 RepID=A0AAW0F1Z8_9TRYP